MQKQFFNPPALNPTNGFTHVVTATEREDDLRFGSGVCERKSGSGR